MRAGRDARTARVRARGPPASTATSKRAHGFLIEQDGVRLFDEVQASTLSDSLQRQTATADVLKVVSRSTFDLKTVLQIFVESVGRICEADMTAIRRPKGSAFLHDASHSSPIVIPSRRSEGPSLGEFC